MTRTIAALTIALLISTGTEAQTGEWEIMEETDEWGDPVPDGDATIVQFAKATLITAGGKNEDVHAILAARCHHKSYRIIFPVRRPNLEADRWSEEQYSVPAKIDGIKGETILWQPRDDERWTSRGSRRRDESFIFIWIAEPRDGFGGLFQVHESLEILFAWGRDEQRQSLTWSVDGLHEVFAEACGEELDAEEG